ncbi:MAG: glutamate synthase (NADPH/NADH) small chain, partial [Maribacter sp.]
MGKITGFLEFDRKVEAYKPVDERVQNYKEFTVPLAEQDLKDQ